MEPGKVHLTPNRSKYESSKDRRILRGVRLSMMALPPTVYSWFLFGLSLITDARVFPPSERIEGSGNFFRDSTSVLAFSMSFQCAFTERIPFSVFPSR